MVLVASFYGRIYGRNTTGHTDKPLESASNSEASQVIPRATVQAILDSASRSTSQSALQSALQSVLDTGNPQFIPKETIQRILESHPTPPPTEPVRELTPDTRPIWPGRIELIYKQYIVEKEAWLTAHPTVRPSNYREKRGLESYSPRWCKEQSRYLPNHRIDLETETILEGRPHWTETDFQALKEQYKFVGITVD